MIPSESKGITLGSIKIKNSLCSITGEDWANDILYNEPITENDRRKYGNELRGEKNSFVKRKACHKLFYDGKMSKWFINDVLKPLWKCNKLYFHSCSLPTMRIYWEKSFVIDVTFSLETFYVLTYKILCRK